MKKGTFFSGHPLRVTKQKKKSNFRIISVTDTIKNEGDNEPDTLDDGNTDTNNVPRDSSENLEDNEQENPNSETSKGNRAKNNQDLENLPNVPVDRSERGGEINTENDTEERDNEEFNPPNKPKSSSKALDSITMLKIEVKGSKGKDIDINKIYDEPNAPDEEHKDINTALIDDDEHLENNERNDQCHHSTKTKNAENNPGSENSWELAADMSERENAVNSEDDTEKSDREEQKPPNKSESLIKKMNNSISTLRPEAKNNKVIKINGRKDEKENVSNDSEKEYIKKLPKTMTVDLSRKGILVLGTEVTLNTNGGNEDSKANMDQMTKIIEHCDSDTDTQKVLPNLAS